MSGGTALSSSPVRPQRQRGHSIPGGRLWDGDIVGGFDAIRSFGPEADRGHYFRLPLEVAARLLERAVYLVPLVVGQQRIQVYALAAFAEPDLPVAGEGDEC